MQICFEKCADAVAYAIENKSFAMFHSFDNTVNLNMHTHDCCELLLCICGGRNFLIDDRVYEACRGDIFVVNQFETHKLTLTGNGSAERYVLQLHPEFLFSISTEETDLSACFYARRDDVPNKVRLSDSELALAEELFSELSAEHGFGDDIIKTAAAAKLLTLTNRAFLDRNEIVRSVPSSVPLKRAILYINEHFGDDITLDGVARNSYISVNQLCKIFKSTLGTTVMKYIIGKRISEAKKLLKSGKNVSDTAMLCGFRDYSNFIRTFSASVGISPGKYSRTD